MFQENKARQIFRKTNISYPLIRTSTCVYQWVRNVRFSENLACFVFLKHPFSDSPFYLIIDENALGFFLNPTAMFSFCTSMFSGGIGMDLILLLRIFPKTKLEYNDLASEV